MAVTIWGSASSWTLTALPLFVWMGEILFRTRLSEDMFRGLAPWLERLPGRLLHTNIIGCTIFAAVSGSSAATCATIGKMTLPELKARGYPEGDHDRHAGRRRHARPADSAVDHHDRLRRHRRRIDRASSSSPASSPASCSRCSSRATSSIWALLHPGRIPATTTKTTFAQKATRVAPSHSRRAPDRAGAGLDLRGRRHRHRGGGVRRRRRARRSPRRRARSRARRSPRA